MQFCLFPACLVGQDPNHFFTLVKSFIIFDYHIPHSQLAVHVRLHYLSTDIHLIF